MTLLALDQATRVSGWAIFKDNELVKWGAITATQNDMGDRLHYIRKQILSLINEYDVDEIVFEDIQLQGNVVNNVDTFKKLAELFGVIHEMCVDIKMPRTAVLASVWKSTLGVKGKDRAAQKRAAAAYVTAHYRLPAISQDIADAICIGTHYLLTSKKEPDYDWSI